jgi:hypothetical protein
VRLIREAASQRDIGQANVALQHVLSRQLDATSDNERVGGDSEGALERAREVGLAALDQRREVCDEYRACDTSIDILTNPARLPCEQAARFVYGPGCSLWVNLLA